MTSGLPRYIGLHGPPRSGKDTLARLLVEGHGYRIVSFAQPLRDACRALNPIVGFDADGDLVRWADLYDSIGYEAAKDHPRYGAEFRSTMELLGTEVGRHILGDDTWVDVAWRDIRMDTRVVFPDVRFPNEARSIAAGGSLNQIGLGSGGVIRVTRPGFGPTNGHVSQTAMDGWGFDAEIVNDGNPHLMLARLLARYGAVAGCGLDEFHPTTTWNPDARKVAP